MNSQAAVAAPPAETDSSERTYRIVAASCAVIAGTVHAIVVPGHLSESWYVGTFFILVYTGQFGLALALVRNIQGPRFVLGAIGANLGVVALYVASRTVELPFVHGHDHSAHTVEHLPVAGGVGDGIPVFPLPQIEPVGVLDLVCLGAELVLIAMLVGLLSGRVRGVVVNVLLGLGLLTLIVRAAGLLG